MYLASVILFLLVLPVASVAVEAMLRSPATIMALAGKWFVFWSIGVRLFIAGMRQVIQPKFTATEIFEIHDPKSFAIVREIGFANLAMGILGLSSMIENGWIVPAALVGGLYYGLAGAGHVFQADKNAKAYIATVSDAFIALVLLVFVVNRLTRI